MRRQAIRIISVRRDQPKEGKRYDKRFDRPKSEEELARRFDAGEELESLGFDLASAKVEEAPMDPEIVPKPESPEE